MSRSEAELVAELRSYLRHRFPGCEVREDWNPLREVVELRVQKPGGRTLLVEVPAEALAPLGEIDIDRALDEWNLAPALREHFRVLLTSRGLEPLPWKQLSPKRDIVEETSEESFPASDSRGFSAISPGAPR